FVPAITFVLAALIAFSTGTSWGTMAILYPLILPASWIMTESAGYDYTEALAIFHNVTASVLAGSVLGDHCSPISDTTILSSLASSCHHIDHVRTQLPYALTVGGVAIFIGIIPAASGISSWVLFPLGILMLYLIVRWMGKKITINNDELRKPNYELRGYGMTRIVHFQIISCVWTLSAAYIIDYTGPDIIDLINCKLFPGMVTLNDFFVID